MNEEAESFLERTQQHSVKDLDHKFRIGNVEHGNDFFQLRLADLIDEALEENTDQRIFLYRIKEMVTKQEKVISELMAKYEPLDN
jgi:hypothetical protein